MQQKPDLQITAVSTNIAHNNKIIEMQATFEHF